MAEDTKSEKVGRVGLFFPVPRSSHELANFNFHFQTNPAHDGGSVGDVREQRAWTRGSLLSVT